MSQVLESKVVVLGNNVDTDQIYPGRFLAIVDPSEIGEHCLGGFDEDIQKAVRGSIIVAGSNFGCGSSREHAVITLLSAGVKAVVAESFARIFYRNAINLGLPLITCKDLDKAVKTGEQVTIMFPEMSIETQSSGVFTGDQLGDYVMQILDAGGLKKMMREKHAI